MVIHTDAIEAWAVAAEGLAELSALPDGKVFARVPGCVGAVSTGMTRSEALDRLRGVLEDWALLGVQVGDDIPVIGGIDLNTVEVRRAIRQREA